MWERVVSWLRRTRLGTWFATDRWKAMVAVSVAAIVFALAVGALAPWPFVQNVVADLVGGLLAGLVIFYLGDIAFGFTERRQREQRALRIVNSILGLELVDNLEELERIVNVLEEGSLTKDDPVFWERGRLKADAWQQLVQSPLVAQLDPELLWDINFAYYVTRRYVKELRDVGPTKFARSPDGYKELCVEHLPKFRRAAGRVGMALNNLQAAIDSIGQV